MARRALTPASEAAQRRRVPGEDRLQPIRQPLAMRLQRKNQWALPAVLLQETDLSVHDPAGLLEDATELNQGPRRTRKASTPAQALERLLSGPPKLPVATTP